ncbi:MAG: hypothetical protein IKO42_01335 [Opitutales bacterium]|nr:hypothetical protein [Opitutales bacterium]
MRLYFKHIKADKKHCEHWKTMAFASIGDMPDFFAYGIVKIDAEAFEVWEFDPFFSGFSQKCLSHETSLNEAKKFCKLDFEKRRLNNE